MNAIKASAVIIALIATVFLLVRLIDNFRFDTFFLLGFVSTVLLMLMVRRQQSVFIFVYSVFLGLFVIEKYFAFIAENQQVVANNAQQIIKQEVRDMEGRLIEGLTTLSGQRPVTGYGPKADLTLSEYLEKDGEIIKDIKYTINSQGLRITSEVNTDDERIQPCLFFFGDSITYGTNLSDDESLPFMVGSSLENKVYNLAYGGYGPHQMYSYITSGKLGKITDCTVNGSIAIFGTNYDHPNRAAGYRQWNKYGPKYEVINGQLVHVGTFSAFEYPAGFNRSFNYKKFIAGLFEKSYAYGKLFNQVSTFDDYDVHRYVTLIKDSEALLESDYGVSEFHVLYYDLYGELQNRRVQDGLENAGIKIVNVSSIVDDVIENLDEYVLYDMHPNKKLNALLSQWILKNQLDGRQWVKRNASLDD